MAILATAALLAAASARSPAAGIAGIAAQGEEVDGLLGLADGPLLLEVSQGAALRWPNKVAANCYNFNQKTACMGKMYGYFSKKKKQKSRKSNTHFVIGFFLKLSF